MKRLLFGSSLTFLTASAMLAQTDSPTPTELSGAAAAGLFGGVCIFQLIMIAIWLFVAIWIMKDAKKRNSPNKTLVTVLGWVVWPVGLIVHLVTRPKTIPGSPNP
jgi:small-conductance mechanosensitive channel